MSADLLGAAFGGRPVDDGQAASLIGRADRLLDRAAALARYLLAAGCWLRLRERQRQRVRNAR